jgi:predicted flap endonuclease-1-like 5' DNA nuclease
METPFKTILEGQQKAWDVWTKSSRQFMDQLSEATKEKDTPADVLTDWFKMQKKIWEEGLKIADLKGAFEQQPEKLQEWAKLQTEFAQQWMDFYTKNAAKLGMKMPKMDKGFAKMPSWPVEAADWSSWLESANQWITENLSAKLPFPQDFHFENFSEVYRTMLNYWEPLQRMSMHGITDWNGISMFFQPEAYRDMVSKFMGFQPMPNMPEMLEQVNTYFEQYTEWLQQAADQPKEWQAQWKDMLNGFAELDGNPMLKVVLNLNHTVQEGLESLYNVAGQNREMEMAKMVKDIQFSYVAFILKTIELQRRVQEAGQFALPETMQHFYQQFLDEQQPPDYQSFFNHFIQVLENAMIAEFHTDEYTKLQNEVAKTGVAVKQQMDQLVELAFADLPFLMQSHVDEVATETSALRKKVRTLEQRLAGLEKQMTAPPATVDDPKAKLLAAIGTATAQERNNLQQIKGVGPKLETMLNDIGIYTFQQLSQVTKAQYALLDELLEAFQGRAERDQWAKQAKDLA